MIRYRAIRTLGKVSGAAAALLVASSTAEAGCPSNKTLYLHGVVRDFRADQTDFVDLEIPPGLVAGTILPNLAPDGKPTFGGPGDAIINEATNINGVPIAPHAVGMEPLANFDINGGVVIPREDFTAHLMVLGVAIAAPNGYLPDVTLRAKAGGAKFEPFGPLNKPWISNLNDDNNPRTFDFPGMFPAGTPVSVLGKSWIYGQAHISANSESNSPQVIVLRDGSPVPQYTAFLGQQSIDFFVRDFIDEASGLITLKKNEAIFLYELGTTNISSSAAADFQDLVVLVSFNRVLDIACMNVSDTPAVAGPPSTGGITTLETFEAWFRTLPGQNVSAAFKIPLCDTGSGLYEYSTPDFTPIDNRLYGNEGQPHNRNFTVEMQANFDYTACVGQFIEFEGGGDLWAFIDGFLVLDLSGSHGTSIQRFELDRLGLDPDQKHELKIFFAQRVDEVTPFRISTNISVKSNPFQLPPAIAIYD